MRKIVSSVNRVEDLIEVNFTTVNILIILNS